MSSMERYFWHLSGLQADGLACVVCGRNFLADPAPTVEVGKEPEHEGSVFGCADPCAGVIAENAERMAAEMRAAAEATAAASDDDGTLGGSGHFGSLMRDLRSLTGAEALLATSDDIPTIRFLLSLTARHAESAERIARQLLAQTRDGED